MSSWKLSALYFASTATALVPCISTTSWGDPRLDVFGVADDFSLWHKFYTGWDWQPASPAVEFLLAGASSGTCPAVSSWGEGRLDVVYIDEDDSVRHKYFGGGAWGPSWDGAEDLGSPGGGAGAGALATASWGEGRLDIVAWSHDGPYAHKAWTGDDWFPSGDGAWEDFGGDFASAPAVASWGSGRLDIVGIGAENGSLLHRYYDGHGWSAWENLGGGPFVGTPAATSWGAGRLDLWAINDEGQLNHLYWDGSEYKGWENLGGRFADTPKVVHWGPSKIDIVGWDKKDAHYRLKSFDGENWSPQAPKDWHKLAGPFVTEPGLSAKSGTNFLYVFGANADEELRLQIWTGYDWQPGYDQTWSLGALTVPSVPEFSSEQSPLEL